MLHRKVNHVNHQHANIVYEHISITGAQDIFAGQTRATILAAMIIIIRCGKRDVTGNDVLLAF
jgi:hypothetical protein